MAKPGPKPGTSSYRPPRPIKERLLSRIEIDENGCWNWAGPRNEKGYGSTFVGSRIDGSRRWAATHRLAYEAWIGPIPDGLTVDHLCANTSCCNPEHLQAVTNAENMRRAADRRDTCAHGHEWTPENTYIRPSGRRICRACKRERSRRAYRERGPQVRIFAARACRWCGERFEPTDNRNEHCSRSCAAKTNWAAKRKRA